MSDYTKGEWGFRGVLPIGFHIYSKNTNNAIAVGIENEADARLIAQAPRMYEALKDIVALGYGYFDFDDLLPIIGEASEIITSVGGKDV